MNTDVKKDKTNIIVMLLNDQASTEWNENLRNENK